MIVRHLAVLQVVTRLGILVKRKSVTASVVANVSRLSAVVVGTSVLVLQDQIHKPRRRFCSLSLLGHDGRHHHRRQNDQKKAAHFF